MRLKTFNYLALVMIAMVLSAYIYRESTAAIAATQPDENPKKEKFLMEAIIGSLESAHFKTLRLDDKFSEQVFDLYLERIDYNKRFLLKKDVDMLTRDRLKLDDQIRSASYDFFNSSLKTIESRIDEAKVYYEEILSKPFDFTIDESIEVDPEKIGFSNSEAELRERWRKILKSQVMARLADMIEDQEKEAEKEDDEKKEEEKTVLTQDEMEVKAREKVKKNYDDWFSRMDKLDREDRISVYLNSILGVYGPHTSYYPPQDKENFDIYMSGKLEGIGARLQERNGYIKVSSIVPGSASARQGELEEGDIILKVAQGADDPVDVVDMPLDDAVKLIRGKKGSEVRLTIKKVDGVTKVVPIIRDIVIISETYAKSALLKNSNNKKNIGYIKLPKFYADFQDRNGRQCADDVSDEIMKLKKEGVEGIILDLRNNGGGSLQEAIDMAGLFIKKGPVVQVKSRGRAPEVLRDYNSGVTYDGPLVVLVNQFSASSSEILAAAIQDYGRGIVIGSPSSFGKGTVQRFIDLDRVVQGSQDIKPLGAIKVTTQKFYRVDGGATQLKGVIPDIILPDNYAYLETGEKEQDFVMPWDEISAVNYEQWEGSLDIKGIRSKSKNRIGAHPTFQLIEENARRLESEQENTEQTLNLEKFRAERKSDQETSKKYKEIRNVVDGLKIKNLKEDMGEINSDEAKKERNEAWIKSLSKDIYLDEALNVIADMK